MTVSSISRHLLIGTLLALSSWGFAADRRSVPSEVDQKAALVTIKDIFKSDLAEAKSGAQWVEVAEKMLGNLQGDAASVASDYVLLTQAQALAIKANSIGTVTKIVSSLAERFDVDGRTVLIAAYRDMAKGPVDRDFHNELAKLALQLAVECQREEKLDAASQCLTVVDSIAAKVKSSDFSKQSALRKTEIIDQRKLGEKLTDARKTLVAKPQDPSANDVVGRHQIGVRNNWDEGLKHLVLSSDTALRAIAQQDNAMVEATAVPTADEIVKVADAWWELTQKQTSPAMKSALKLRAGQWYALALPNLKALSKAKAEQRISDSSWDASSNLEARMPTNRESFELDRLVSSGKGLRTRDWAVCQTLSYDDAIKLTKLLEPKKQRPIRFRPYQTPDGLKVAGLWFRSVRPGELFDGTSDEVQKRFDEAIKANQAPVDLAGYFTADGQMRHVLLLTESQYAKEVELTLTVGWPMASGKYGKEDKTAPSTRHFFMDTSGKLFVDVFWHKPRGTFYYAGGTKSFLDRKLSEMTTLVVDVSLARLEKRTDFSFISHGISSSKHNVVYDKSLDETLIEWKSLTQSGWHPGSVCVLIGHDEKYHSISVWHQPTKK